MHPTRELTIDSDSSVTKIDQIVRKIKRDIEVENLKSHQRLLSISEFSKQHKVSKDTVEKAYRELQRQGYIFSVSGKGNYVSKAIVSAKRILMVVDKLDSYNREIYSAFSRKLGNILEVDLQIHYNDPVLLNEVALSSLGKYDFYVIVPPPPDTIMEGEFESALGGIPVNKIIVLDGISSSTTLNCINIVRDFSEDVFEAFSSHSDLFDRYRGIVLIVPDTVNQLSYICEGLKKFCVTYSKSLVIKSCLEGVSLNKGEVYIVYTESHLADITRKLRNSLYLRGKDIGLISLQDSVLNELLDITVVTGNFEALGETAAQLILQNQVLPISNAYRLIQRGSL
ncbi:GntR family transcriptional regulator [Paradesertivirga mongoliensis]|uniref:GntR family transcriptional regulator n=2 Tax=Paradesertivirga mongoliensis TaxID=2100740 RepID=A0ABW4ZQI9_9SPHI